MIHVFKKQQPLPSSTDHWERRLPSSSCAFSLLILSACAFLTPYYRLRDLGSL